MAILRRDNSEIVKYNSTEVPIYLRGGRLSDYPNFSEIAHWHNDIELIALLDGEMQFNVNGNILPLSAGLAKDKELDDELLPLLRTEQI